MNSSFDMDTSTEKVQDAAEYLVGRGAHDVDASSAGHLMLVLLKERDSLLERIQSVRYRTLQEAAVVARDAKTGDPGWGGDAMAEYVAQCILNRAQLEIEDI